MKPEVNFACYTCGNGLVLPLGEPRGRSTCTRCGGEAHLLAADPDGRPHEEGGHPLPRCAVCGSGALFVQRDFNRKLGIAIIALAALVAVPTRGISLAVAVLVDLVLYRFLPRITVCYACDAIHRGISIGPELGSFDHHVADEFKVEKAKRQLARRRWLREHDGHGD